MKIHSCILAVGLLAAYASYALPVGSFKAIDAYCSNPAYVYSPEEQAYIDSVRGKGACIDGNKLSPPCFEDYYVFLPSFSGQLVTKIADISGISCVIRTEMTYSENRPGTLEFILGKSTSESQSNDHNTEIFCNQDSEGNKLTYQYKQENSFLLLYSEAGTDCGDFIFKLQPVSDVP